MSDPARQHWQLRPLRIDGMEAVYVIVPDGLVLGRDPLVDVSVDAQLFPHVSAQHTRILWGENGPTLQDLESKNGTYVNGHQVEQAELKNGDVIQLGSIGPRFVVSDPRVLSETITLHKPANTPDADFGKTTVLRLKSALGIESDGVTDMVETGARKQTVRLLMAFVMIVAVMAAAVFWIRQQAAREQEASRELTAALEQHLSAANEKLEEQARQSESLREALREERDRLQQRLAELETQERASAGEVQRLRDELARTEQRLELFDPVELTRSKLRHVDETRRAVVLVEIECQYVETSTGRILRETDVPGMPDHTGLTLDESRGSVYRHEGTGSGFCVSADGWIITNAHVVTPDALGFGDVTLEPTEVKIRIVFTDQSLRHDATIVKTVYTGAEDLALLKIAPFSDMPVVAQFQLDEPPPPVGSELYLFGFPLGKHALHEQDRMIASTFKGILSRQVDHYLQVDAAVHLGNSGGPVVDPAGRVVGVVVGVQTTPEGAAAPAIGYVIPIAMARAVWPPDGL